MFFNIVWSQKYTNFNSAIIAANTTTTLQLNKTFLLCPQYGVNFYNTTSFSLLANNVIYILLSNTEQPTNWYGVLITTIELSGYARIFL